MRRLVNITIFLLITAVVKGQLLVKVRMFDEDAAKFEQSLGKPMDDSKRLDILLQLAAHSLYKMDHGASENSDLDKAATYVSQIKELRAKVTTGNNDALIALLQSTLSRKTGDSITARKLAKQAIRDMDTRESGYYLALSHIELSRCYDTRNPSHVGPILSVYHNLFKTLNKRLPRVHQDTLSFDLLTFYIAKMRGDGDSTKLAYLEQLVKCFKTIGDKTNEFWTRKEIGDIHYHQGKMTEAINELLVLSKEQEMANGLRLCWTYDLLSGLYSAIHVYDKAIYYSLQTLKAVKNHEDSSGLTVFYGRVAANYSNTGSTEEAIKWNLKRLDHLTSKGQTYTSLGLISRITNDMIKLNRSQEALNMILERSKTIKPVGNGEKQYLLLTLARCYSAVNNNVMAEKYCKDVIALNDLRIKLQELTNDPEVDGFLASFYFKMGDYEKAEFYFNRVVVNNPNKENDTYYNSFHYKLDSARGNYPSAIKHLKAYHRIKDSIFTEAKARQVDELKISYATEEKDSIIRLNEQNIGLLTKQDLLQKSQLRQGVLLRNISIGVAALLVIIVGLLFNRYRVKQRTNKKLELQQSEIAKQNHSLQQLVSEKEWLLKEIHHRVKNNLQIVMSLLNSQSAYIDNEPALTAIQDSQHRVHAMSLIHQKLYGTENVSTIDMSLYIGELVSYLRDSFSAGQRIRFECRIEPLELDVSQAVPLGLILNEAITNSLKYAFPDGRKGVISIDLSRTPPGGYLLCIADNGIGMPLNADNKKPGSLGLNLMEGLTGDLDGEFSIENKNGTTICISFARANVQPGILNESFTSNN